MITRHPSYRLAFTLAVLLVGGVGKASVVYVNRNASGAVRDGHSWATALANLQDGINAATSGDEVWVAASTPAATAYKEFVILTDGVAVYGGFSGTENLRSQRDFIAHPTVLDGTTVPTYVGALVQVPAGLTHEVTLDGLTVTRGAGGIQVLSPTSIAHCIVTHNVYSSGISVSRTTATITNTAIADNATNGAGGGIVIGYDARVTISNCLIWRNAGYVGGGVYMNAPARVDFINVTVAGNSSSMFGGGIYAASYGIATVVNSVIALNSAGISTNSSWIFTVKNTDVFANGPSDYSGMVDPTGADGNLSQDPLFVNQVAGDFRLLPGSPCVNFGDDSAVAAGSTDLDGKARIIGAHVDMGAFESGYDAKDVTRSIGIAGGVRASSSDDITRLNVESGNKVLNLADAVRIARKAAGLDANP